ncbi:MAG: TRZ/ATZ family protein [Clostridia bacterium]|nr:TRZ/ATZ family protein [Clostridia bacterium]
MINLTLPISDKQIRSLKAGDTVALSGVIHTARDAAHKRICETLEKREQPPIELDGAVIYYCGPTPAREGEVIGSCGPTTSARMDDYAPTLIAQGAKIMIGKGKRSEAVRDAVVKYGGLYLAAVGGAGALMKSYVKKCDLIAYGDLGCEAVYALEVENMELIVAMDCLGNTILR